MKAEDRNLIYRRLPELRRQRGLSQRELAQQLQLRGLDIDKNVITRIETNKRHVKDVELKILAEYFRISFEELLSSSSERN